MADNVRPFTRPVIRVPERWRAHANALSQLRSEIDALRLRLEEERRQFLDVMKEDIAKSTSTADGRRGFFLRASRRPWEWRRGISINARDALTLLECASERVSYATPSDYDLEFLPPEPAGPRSDAS